MYAQANSLYIISFSVIYSRLLVGYSGQDELGRLNDDITIDCVRKNWAEQTEILSSTEGPLGHKIKEITRWPEAVPQPI